METITVYPAATQHKARLPDGIEVDATVASQLGIRDGDTVTKAQMDLVFRATLKATHNLLAQLGSTAEIRKARRTEQTYDKRQATGPAWRRNHRIT